MGQPYVDYPGTNGRHASCPSVNLLDADTAHIQQSNGGWKNYYQAKLPAQSTAMPPKFGDSHLEFQSTTTGAAHLATATGTDATPVSPNTEHASGAWMASPDGYDLRVYLATWDSGGSLVSLGSPIAAKASPTPGTWYRLEGSRTTEANAAYASTVLYFAATAADKLCYGDAFIIAEGSDATFKPSQNIVGTIDARMRVALDDYGRASRDSIWSKIGSIVLTTNGQLFRFDGYDGGRSVEIGDLSTLTDGDIETFKFLCVPDGAGSIAFSAYTLNADGSTWNLFATSTDAATVNAFAVATNPLRIVSYSGSVLPMLGNVYWFEYRDGDDGPLTASFRARQALAAVA